jgi:ribosomal protein L23
MRNNFVLIITVISLLIANVANAKGIFAINNVNAKGSGQTAKEAKNNAIEIAQETAFQELLKRITPDYTQHLWPTLEKEEISELVQGINIDKENVTSTRYEAQIDIVFNEIFVEKLLQESGVSYTGNKADPVLLLPLLISNGEGVIWDGNNYWQGAWEEALEDSSFANFIIPEGDLGDISAVNVESLMEGEPPFSFNDREKIQFLVDKYNVEKVMLAKAFPSEYNGTIGVEVETAYISEDEPKKNSRKFYGKAEDEKVRDVMVKAAWKIISNTERKWKEEQEQIRQSKSEMNINVPVKDIGDWQDTYKKLRNFDFINKIHTKYITVEFISVDLFFQDGYEKLVMNLARNGMFLERRSNGLFLRKHDSMPSWFEPASYEGYIMEGDE